MGYDDEIRKQTHLEKSLEDLFLCLLEGSLYKTKEIFPSPSISFTPFVL